MMLGSEKLRIKKKDVEKRNKYNEIFDRWYSEIIDVCACIEVLEEADRSEEGF